MQHDSLKIYCYNMNFASQFVGCHISISACNKSTSILQENLHSNINIISVATISVEATTYTLGLLNVLHRDSYNMIFNFQTQSLNASMVERLQGRLQCVHFHQFPGHKG